MSSELLGIALAGIISGAMVTQAMPMIADYQKLPFENQAGAKFDQFNTAVRNYVHANLADVHNDALDGTVDALANITPADLIAGGFLPSGWSDDNFFNQSHYAIAKDAGTADDDVVVMTFTYGGEVLNPSKLSQVLANAGNDSGMISRMNAANAVGRAAGWTIPIADFTGGSQTPTVGNFAGYIHVTSEDIATGGGGGGGGPSFSTDINMNNNNINNVNKITADTGDITNLNSTTVTTNTLNATTANITTLNVGDIYGTGDWTTTGSIHADINITAGGNISTVDGDIVTTNGDIISTNGTVTGTDVISSATGNRLSEAVTNVFLVAHGDTVTKPVCMTGQTQEIFVIPSNMSDNGVGKPLHRFDGAATDAGASWTIDLSVVTEDGTVNPNATFGRAVAFIKCTS